MSSTRTQRVARLLKEELSRIIRKEMEDPRLAFWSITNVEVTPDLRLAKVFVSVYGTPEEQSLTIEVLENARGFLRGALSRAVDLRYTPDLQFELDTSIERGAHIFELLSQIDVKKEEPADDES